MEEDDDDDDDHLLEVFSIPVQPGKHTNSEQIRISTSVTPLKV
jgi:hypothetical protein